MHKDGFFLHFLNESVMVNKRAEIRESLDSFTEYAFFTKMVRI